jgi:beta-mannosidase
MFAEWRATAVDEGGSAEQTVTVPGRPDDFAGADGVSYVTTFEDPRSGDDDVAVIELCGLYAHADVDVPGDRLDGEGTITHDAYFDPVRVPVRPDEDNELAVTCHAPRDRFGGLHDTDRVPESERVPGIWWGASVETHPLPYIDRLRVSPELTDDGAVLHVNATVVTDGPLEDRITYSLKPEGDVKTGGMMNRGAVEASGPGKTTVEHTIEVHDPALWWPRDLGKQRRYTLRAKLGDSERSATVGIRSVDRDDGRFLVNGEPLPVRGVNLLTDDPADVERAREVNANLVRAPAHVLSPAVYEACDEAGLLVWQGLPLTGPGEFDVERGQMLAETLIDAYGPHPSFAAVGVHDDPVETFPDVLGSGLLDRLRLRWRAWRTSYDRGPAESIAAAVPDRHPVVPVVGGPGIDHDAAAYYPGWDYGTAADVDALLDRYPTDLLAAFGAGALAGDTTTAAGFDADKHDVHVDGGPEASQAYQAEVVRTVAETARRRGVGAVVFALRDIDDAGMGVYAADGTAKTARRQLGAVFQPVRPLLADPSPGESEVVVVNDGPTSLSATLSWEAGDETDETELTVDAADRWSGTITVPDSAGTLWLGLAVGEKTVEYSYDLDE